jgi:hypothetical protein
VRTVYLNYLTLCSASLSLLREIVHGLVNSQMFTIPQPLPRTLHYIIPTADSCLVSASVPDFVRMNSHLLSLHLSVLVCHLVQDHVQP